MSREPQAVSRPVVVFDLDGTLVDSIDDLGVAVNRLLAENGGRSLRLDEVSGMVGEGASLLLARAFGAAGIPGDPEQALPRFLEIYDAVLPGRTRAYPGVTEMLRVLHGAAPLAVLTNKPAAAAEKILRMLDLDRYIGAVVGGDGPLARKPSPDGLLHLIAAAGAVPGSTWMVGDSVVDLLTARAAGTRACIVTYGFGFASFDRASVRSGEMFADRPEDVAALVLDGRHGC